MKRMLWSSGSMNPPSPGAARRRPVLENIAHQAMRNHYVSLADRRAVLSDVMRLERIVLITRSNRHHRCITNAIRCSTGSVPLHAPVIVWRGGKLARQFLRTGAVPQPLRGGSPGAFGPGSSNRSSRIEQAIRRLHTLVERLEKEIAT